MPTIGLMPVADDWLTVTEEPPISTDDREGQRLLDAPPPGEQFEVLIVAAGEAAAQYALALRRQDCCRPDSDGRFAGARVVSLEATRSGPTSSSDHSWARDYLHGRLVAAYLIVFVVSDDGPWDAVLSGHDPLLREVSGARLVVIDWRAASGSVTSVADSRAREPKGLTMGRDGLASERAGHEQLDSVPAAILYALFQPGILCIDYDKYLQAHGGGPGVAGIGFGRAEPGTALTNALEDAYTAWRGNCSALVTAPSVAMLIIGDSLDQSTSARELQSTAERFLAQVAPIDTQRLVALPLLGPGATEVALITKHQTPAG